MQWDAIAAIAELVAAFGVIVSLVYVAFQVRQNTRQIDQNTRASQAAAFDSSITHAMVARQAIFENEDVARIYHRGSLDPDSLSEEEWMRYRLMLHNALWSIWNLQSQAQIGTLASETWQAQHATLRRVVASPGARRFWAHYGEEFGPTFRREVERILVELGAEGDTVDAERRSR